MSQVLTPNPDIPCQPGWCLAYVNEAFGVRKVYGSATAAWEASPSKHWNKDFPPGCWVPVWFSLANEPAGHVALLAPDGSVYSTSDLGNVPHHHPSLDDLIGYYAYYGMPLTYLGWTEDVEGTPVISLDGINYEGSITPTLGGFLSDLSAQDQQNIYEAITRIDAFVKSNPVAGIVHDVLFENRVDGRNIVDTGRQSLFNDAAILAALSGLKVGNTITAADIAAAIPADIAKQVADLLAERLAA